LQDWRNDCSVGNWKGALTTTLNIEAQLGGVRLRYCRWSMAQGLLV
jgi:hypothetical protein